MEYLSVKDMFKIGVGPSSSHTLGPWKAALDWVGTLETDRRISSVSAHLYGSLSLTGRGHATDVAVVLGLCGYDPEKIDTGKIDQIIEEVHTSNSLVLGNGANVAFNLSENIIFESDFLDFHANALSFYCKYADGSYAEATYYSIGGGFITRGEDFISSIMEFRHPYPIEKAKDLERYCNNEGKSIFEVVRENELTYISKKELDEYLLNIWDVMLESIFKGCHREGVLPGGLDVRRRAPNLYRKLYVLQDYSDKYSWFKKLRGREFNVSSIFKWVSCFALAVNEENAAMGRVVTAPTNGSAGVVPAVLMFYLTHYDTSAGDEKIVEFLCVASEIGSIFKKGATISAAMGGCQAEIGVSSAMAAAGLTHVLGGSFRQCIMAAEMAMEHHLGLTCDPVGGLVQIPCIERNSMGAIKAINAAELALDSDPDFAKIPLDKVVATMWATAQDMHRKYKETSEGGLAVDVSAPEC